MFVTLREPGVRRRSRMYSTSKAARSSKISLLTITTTSSGDSNNTITQESYNKSQKPRRRKHREHRSRTVDDQDHKSVDVFDFLVEDGTKSKESLQDTPNRSAAVQDADSDAAEGNVELDEDMAQDEPEVIVQLDDADPEGYYRSMSDSGISMGSSSSGGGRPKNHLTVVREESSDSSSPRPRPATELALIDPRWAWPTSSPQPYHDGFIPPPCPAPPPAVVYDVPHYPSYPYPGFPSYDHPPTPPEDIIPGPSLTIREPAGQRVEPKYFRSFSKVSTRLLLHMQDEIAELERELKQLDKDVDEAEQVSERGSTSSRSSRLVHRRHEDDLYAELQIKLDNYYHALEMMQKVEDISKPTVVSDRGKYHQWLESRVLETDRIRHLISNDLRKFTSSKDQNPQLSQTFQPQYLAYSALVNAVVPLILFKLIGGVLNRLIFLSIVAAVGAIGQDKMRTKIGKDELTCTLVCICISAFAAIFL